MMKPFLTLFLFAFILALVSRAQDKPGLFHEDFSSLDNGKPFFFPNIKKHSVYSLKKDNENHVLKVESLASGSAVCKDALKVYDYPCEIYRGFAIVS